MPDSEAEALTLAPGEYVSAVTYVGSRRIVTIDRQGGRPPLCGAILEPRKPGAICRKDPGHEDSEDPEISNHAGGGWQWPSSTTERMRARG